MDWRRNGAPAGLRTLSDFAPELCNASSGKKPMPSPAATIHDLYGDGSIVIVPAPGHTPG